MLRIGDTAPSFCLLDADDREVCLKDFENRYIVLYFYPKDNTSGCTKEAIGFSDHIEEIRALGGEVIGISKDSTKSHKNFINKHNLKIILLSDPEHKVIEMYGAWQLKKRYGREYYGITRSTFIIDKKGKIAYVWPNVKVKGHVEDVINKLKEIVS